MKKQLQILATVLLLTACAEQKKAENQTDSSAIQLNSVAAQPENKEKPSVVRLIGTMPWYDSTGTPHVQIRLTVDRKEVWSKELIGEWVSLDKSTYANLNIPDSVIEVHQSFWAGSGEIFYLIKQNDRWQLKSCEIGEGMSEDELYRYTTVKEVY